MKKILTYALAFLLLFGLTACSKSDTDSSDSALQLNNTASSTENSDSLTPFIEMNGSWRFNIISDKEISVVKVSVNGTDGDLLCLRGAEYNTYEKSLTDQRPDDSETINGIKYWYEVGDSCYLTYTVDNNSVMFYSDEFDMKFTLTRVNENSMKVTSSENIPQRFYELKTGCIFNFEAE